MDGVDGDGRREGGSGGRTYNIAILLTHDTLALRNTDTEHTQEDVPQIETQLIPHMVNEIGFSLALLV